MRTPLPFILLVLSSGCTYEESYLACVRAPDTNISWSMGLQEIEPPEVVGSCISAETKGTDLGIDGGLSMVPLCVEGEVNLYLQPGNELLEYYGWVDGEAVELEAPEGTPAAECPDELVEYRLPDFGGDRSYGYIRSADPRELLLWMTPRDPDEWPDSLW